MSHGLEIDTGAAAPLGAADRVMADINAVVVTLSSIALVIASFVLTYSVIVRYFLKISTDCLDESI